MSRKKELSRKILGLYAQMQTAVHTAEMLQRAYSALLEQKKSRVINDQELQYISSVNQAQDYLKEQRTNLIHNLESVLNSGGFDTAAWSSGLFSRFSPASANAPARYIRIGELQSNQITNKLLGMPALLPLIGQKHVLIAFDERFSNTGCAVIESTAWRILISTKPGSIQFILMDPLDSGSNLASLLKLPESVRGRKIYCQEDEIESALALLSKDIEDIIQNRLLNTHPNIEAYNRANPDVAIPFRVLFFVGFPKSLRPRSAELLFSIARTGPRCGVYLVVGVLRGQKIPYDFQFVKFKNMSSYVTVAQSTSLDVEDPNYRNISITPDRPPPAPLMNMILREWTPLANAISSNKLNFKRFAVRKAIWWQGNSSQELEAVLGIDEKGNPFKFTLGSQAQHALLAGTTGYGKTNLLHLLILNLVTMYSPDELELYLVDFKEGVEFQDYATYLLAHAKAVVLQAEREFGLSVLLRLVEEMDHRSEILKSQGVTNLQQYRQKTNFTLARILLIIDEFVVLFNEDDQIAIQARDALEALVLRGRSFGIHVLLSAQRPLVTFFSMSQIKSQMGLRIALKCLLPEDSSLILGEGNEKATRLNSPGEACITYDPTQPDLTRQVRIIFVKDKERVQYLQALHELGVLNPPKTKFDPVFFQRDAPASWLKCSFISRRLTKLKWAPLSNPAFWIGQPIKIAKDISITLDTIPGNHLLVLGKNEDMALRILISSLMGLLLTCRPDQIHLVVIGLLDPQKKAAVILNTIKSQTPHTIRFSTRQAAIQELDQITQELDERVSTFPSSPQKKMVILIPGLQNWFEVKGQNTYTPSPSGEQLSRIWQNGAQFGIHTLVWTDRLDSLGQVVGSSVHSGLANFNHRVTMQITPDESINMLGKADAARLGAERALYRDERNSIDEISKFKPYAWLTVNEMDHVIEKLNHNWNA